MFFPFVAGYAETHYKFRLPWSPLHDPWPEILLDAPGYALPGEPLQAWLVVRDANLYPVRIHGISLRIDSEGMPDSRQVVEVNQTLQEPFHFLPVSVDLGERKGPVRVHARIDAERIGYNVRKSIHGWNFPGLEPRPLRCTVLTCALPKPQGWWAGETHCHTWHSSDPVEFGAPPSVLQAACRPLGLDFAFLTDHSYDFAFRRDAYTVPADPEERWNEFRAECARLPAYPLIVPGEEVSCGNARGENVHLLVPGHPEFIPGMGDSGRAWLRNRPTLSIAEVLQRAQGVPCIAAHPFEPAGWLERKVFRRGHYAPTDLHQDGTSHLIGYEFWNGRLDHGALQGRHAWIRQLLQGHRLLPIGGNDAHGDLNCSTAVKIPLLRLKVSEKRFGRVRTVVQGHTGQTLSQESLFAAMFRARESGSLYATSGPALTLHPGGGKMLALAKSTPDLGELSSLSLYWARQGDIAETRLDQACKGFEAEHAIEIPAKCAYVRAECRTRKGETALSAATWI